jgi:hypothetical protein
MPDPETLKTADFLVMWTFRGLVTAASSTIAYYAFKLTRWATSFEMKVAAGFEAATKSREGIHNDIDEIKTEVARINGNVDKHGETIAVLKVVCPSIAGRSDDEDCE